MASCAPTSVSLMRQASRQSSSGDVFSEELELLQNVYLDEMIYDPQSCDHTGHTLQFHVTPSTGDDKERQYVYLVLNIFVPKEYPLVSPECTVGQSRGLSDSHLRSIVKGLTHRCEELLGCQMIYELVEFAKDSLTDNNLPSGECAICLNGFKDCDEFKKTDCYHYFHLPCLAGYLEYYQRQVKEDLEEDSKVDMMLRKKTRQLECPVCRVPMGTPELTADLTHEWSSPSGDSPFVPSLELRAWQKRMEELLWKQRQKGGIIDQSQSDVIDGSWVSTRSSKSKDEQLASPTSASIEDSKPPSVSIIKNSDLPRKSQKRQRNGFNTQERDYHTSTSPQKSGSRRDATITSNRGGVTATPSRGDSTTSPNKEHSRTRTREGYRNTTPHSRQRGNRHPSHSPGGATRADSGTTTVESQSTQAGVAGSREPRPSSRPQRQRNGETRVNRRPRGQRETRTDKPNVKGKEQYSSSRQESARTVSNSDTSDRTAEPS